MNDNNRGILKHYSAFSWVGL